MVYAFSLFFLFNRLHCMLFLFKSFLNLLLKMFNKFSFFLALIQSQQSNDSRRAYQLMKFLVSLANRLQIAKDYLLQSPCKWQWSVNWLKQKIEQSYWSPHADLSNENSNTRIFQRTTSAQVDNIYCCVNSKFVFTDFWSVKIRLHWKRLQHF
jgi:hypothetical protein